MSRFGVLVPADETKPLRECTRQELEDEYRAHPLFDQHRREMTELDNIPVAWTQTSSTFLSNFCVRFLDRPLETVDPDARVLLWSLSFDDYASLKPGLVVNHRATMLAREGLDAHKEHQFTLRGDAFLYVDATLFKRRSDDPTKTTFDRDCGLRVPVDVVEALLGGRNDEANAKMLHADVSE